MKHLALLEKCGRKEAKPVSTIHRIEKDQAVMYPSSHCTAGSVLPTNACAINPKTVLI